MLPVVNLSICTSVLQHKLRLKKKNHFLFFIYKKREFNKHKKARDFHMEHNYSTHYQNQSSFAKLHHVNKLPPIHTFGEKNIRGGELFASERLYALPKLHLYI